MTRLTFSLFRDVLCPGILSLAVIVGIDICMMSPIESLPNDILLVIFLAVELTDFLSLRQVCVRDIVYFYA